VSGPLAETFDNTDRSSRSRIIRRVLIAAALVFLILAALVVVHEVTGWAGPGGSIEWLHSKATGSNMASVLHPNRWIWAASILRPTRWCWG
jgi:hypothetical protein